MSNDAAPRDSALDWAMEAMKNAQGRVNLTQDAASAFVAVGETVWWITAVNDVLLKRHPEMYESAVALTTPNPTKMIRGVRHARHRIGHGLDIEQFVEPFATRGERTGYR
jgi:hypothetical protein